MIGETFNRLKVLGEAGRDNGGRRRIIYQCVCGNIKEADAHMVKSGGINTCGCKIGAKKPRKNITGVRFHRLLVVSFNGFNKRNEATWLCKCDCGEMRVVIQSSLRYSRTKSCGCFTVDRMRLKQTTHGMYGTGANVSWQSMKARCYNENNNKYGIYGGRGIKVCDRWIDSFQNFYDDMGDRPKNKSIDRIDSDGDYTPENCRWADPIEQCNNTRTNRMIRLGVISDTLRNWSRMIPVPHSTLISRMSAGWNDSEILLTPVGVKRLRSLCA